MPSGSCLCGDVKISYTGEPQGKALCYCRDCQKITGSAFSTNFLIPADQFKLDTGSPIEYTKDTDTGNKFTSYLCGKCGTTVWRQGTKYEGVKVLKAGVLDNHDIEGEQKFSAELFAPRRGPWIKKQEGVDQIEGTM